ncbi:Amidase domain-containing protein [Mycena chlorophos]|uniref:amidase n=1 Tax=Mycena chlorophos TaxID=658473 RepID=A0A8H6WDR7_MYCCL|nr:Amidase domain-containing protein [Mycena chlorophos]
MTWQQIAADKKKAQLDAVPKDWLLNEADLPKQIDVSSCAHSSPLLSPLDLEITESSVSVLLGNLASAKWSSLQVTTSFSKRAVLAQQLTNCLTEIFIDRALARAKELDEHLKKTGSVVGPLHGLPVSLKDQISIQGLDSTIGYVGWIGKPATENAAIVDILEELGAVFYVKTNIPQTLMWLETFNHIFGRTTNPHNRTLTCGGSSGGEAALIAFKGSPLGVGSDVGGSVRVPAAFCGTYGFRPSYHRIPYRGCANSLQGQDSIPSVLGPFSNTLDGLTIFMKAVLSKRPWLKDPLVVRKSWDEDAYSLVEHGGPGAKLCYAIMWDDGFVKPDPTVRRGLEITKKALEAAGHEVIDWKPHKQAEIGLTTLKIWASASEEDGATVAALTGEPLVGSMDPEADIWQKRPMMAGPLSAYQLWQVQKAKRDLREEYLDHWARTVKETSTGRPVDAIISPVAPYAAPPHGKSGNIFYTIWCNLLDYPSVVVPVGAKVDPVLDAKQPRTEFYTEFDKQNYEKYDPALYENAPLSIQVVGRTMEDEALLAMTKIVDDALQATAL